MDIAGVSSSLALAGVAGQVDTGVLKLLMNLDQTVAAQLSASIGLGTVVDAYA
ncbi:MAG TPA: hypothetical protein VFE36_04860 [Candidatus Baltobacteraceae bacterium]|nr:hypothetical protein [Candidatus Baltobacteraceae bacterium]